MRLSKYSKTSWIVLSLLSLFLLVSACDKPNSKKQAEKQSPPNQNQLAAKSNAYPMSPNWTMVDLDGKNHSLADYKGKVVILDFWDTWCPPCKKEIPGFIELQEKYKDQGLVVIGAAFGRDGKMEVAKFARSWKINYPVLLANKEVNDLFGGIRSIPTTYVLDKEGRIRASHIGFAPKEKFEEEIKPLL